MDVSGNEENIKTDLVNHRTMTTDLAITEVPSTSIQNNARETFIEEAECENTKITTVLKPLLDVCKMLGVVSKKPLKRNVRFLFIFVAQLVILIRVGVFFSASTKFDSTFIATLLIFLYFFKGIMSMYYLLRILGSMSGPFFALWQDMVRCHYSSAVKRMKSWVIVGLLYAFLCSATSACAVTLNSLQIGFQVPILESILIAQRLKFLNAVLIFIAALYNYLCQMTYFLLCIVICHEFDHLVTKLHQAKAKTDEELLHDIITLRAYHYNVIKMSDILNNSVSYYTFWLLSINVPMLFAAAYVLGSGQWNSKDILTLTCCSVKVFLEILTITIPPSLISYSTFHQISLFVQQISRRVIGITCGGFFMLSKEALLTILSTIVTYFTIILQLDFSAKFYCDCNCK